MDSINKILVPTDFSSASLKALAWTIEIAYKLNAKLYVLHAYSVPIAVDQGMGTMHPPQLNYEQSAYNQLEDLEKKLAPQLKKIRYELLAKPTPISESIELLTQAEHIDLVVMSTKGAEGIGEIFMGTNTADVADQLNIPVLVIPEETDNHNMTKIGFAYDYKGLPNPDKLNALKDIVTAFNADLHVVYVSDSMEPAPDEQLKSMESIDKKFLKANRYYQIHLSDDVEKGIRDYVGNNDIDLLAVMPREHGFFHKLFRKSISKKLTFHANTPLLILQN